MRLPTAYEIYLHRLKDYYKIKHLECPTWIDKASSCYSRLYYSHRSFADMCSNTAIPKYTMEYLANLETENMEDIPDELIEGSVDINAILKEMYKELMSKKELYFF